MLDIAEHISSQNSVEYDFSRLKKLYAKFDKRRLQQVVLNMALNAAKLSKKITFATKLIPEEITYACKTMIEISVIDEEIGIFVEDLPHITTPSMNQQESDLGLSNCKRICESLGGGFTVESGVGQGTKFTARMLVQIVRTDFELDSVITDGLDSSGLYEWVRHSSMIVIQVKA